MMKLSACLKRMFTSRLGNVSIVFALASPLVIGSAALSVETSYWYYKQHQLQAAADNAAFAAGHELRNGSSQDVVKTAALNAAAQNGYDNSIGTITLETPPSSGPDAGLSTAVKVTLTETQKRFFTQFFSTTPVVAAAKATANWQTTSNACILALDPKAAQAAYFSGSAQLTLTGCVVMSDSAAANGVYVWGAASLTASCVVSAGGVQQKTGGIDDTGCVKPLTDAHPAADPYKDLPWPTTLANTPCVTPSGTNLSPGHYCSLDIGGANINLAPGQYVVDSMTGHGNGSLTGSGVTIFTNGGNVDINGNTTLNLSAPTSGTYQGILFYGSRSVGVGSCPGALCNTFNGTASSLLTGALYFPTQAVAYQGNFSGLNGCTQVVADTVSFSGNTSFNVNCGSGGPPTIPATTAVTLVG